MENLTWLGFIVAGSIGAFFVVQMGGFQNIWNWHGLVEVLGGVLCTAMINYPFSQLRRAATWMVWIFLPERLPSLDDVAAEILRLSNIAKSQGGLLALQNEGRTFARGWLNRAILVAIAAGEHQRTREILEADLRQTRTAQQEDANFFRTIGMLAPMFGLLGTLLGIIGVLRSISDPTKVGPAMSLAITASMYGIAFANMICIPIAGHIRMRTMHEARVMEAIMEGVLDLMRSESQYLLELRLGSYSLQRREASAGAAGAPAA